MKGHSRGEFGFNLIELLVVVAVIAILTSLILPALSSAKAYAHSNTCKNHLRQMGMALQMYVHDNQNRYPHYLGPAGPSYGDAIGQGGRAVGLVYWSSKLFPYYSLNWTNTAYHCPGYNGKISGPYELGAVDRLGSYAYNTWGVGVNNSVQEYFALGPIMFWKDTQGIYVPAVSESRVSVPSEMLAIGDSPMKLGEFGGDDVGRCVMHYASEDAELPYVVRHGKKENQLACDGHVLSMAPETLHNPTNTAVMWNYDHQPHSELWGL